MSENDSSPPISFDFSKLKEDGDLKQFSHGSKVFFHLHRGKKNYYYRLFSGNEVISTFVCTDYDKDDKKSCISKVFLRENDSFVKLSGEHSCGTHHYFIDSEIPIIAPLFPYMLNEANSDVFENKIYHVQPERVNIKQLWRRNMYGKVYFSYLVDQNITPFCPERSKIVLRLILKDNETIVEDLFVSNCGKNQQIICVKPTKDLKNEELIGANYVVDFRLPTTTIIGQFDVEIYINNTFYYAKKENCVEYYKEFIPLEEQVDLLEENDELSSDFAFMFYTNHLCYGNYFFDKIIYELCKGDVSSCVTNEIIFREVLRIYQKKFDCFGFNLLIHFSSRGLIEFVDFVLEEGYDVNYQDHCGNTALFWANKNDQKNVVELLIKKEADVTIRNKQGKDYIEFANAFREDKCFCKLQEEIIEIENEETKKKNEELNKQLKEVNEKLPVYENLFGGFSLKELKIEIECRNKALSKSKIELSNYVLGKNLARDLAVRKSLRFKKKGKDPIKSVTSPKKTKIKKIYKGIKGKLKKLGRKMKKKLINDWDVNNILDWLESIKLHNVFESFILNNEIKRNKQLVEILENESKGIETKSVSDKDKYIFEGYSEKEKLLFLFHIKYLQISKKKFKTFQKKDYYYTILSKLRKIDDFSTVSMEEIENLIELLKNEKLLSENIFLEKESVTIRILMVNEVFSISPLKQYINFCFGRYCLKDIKSFSDIYISGLLFNDLYLEWNKTSLIIPRKIKEETNYVSFDIIRIPLEKFNEIKGKIEKFIVKWNVSKKYHRTNLNCQHFIEEIFKFCLDVKLGYDNVDEAKFIYLENIKKNGGCRKIPIENKPITEWDEKDCLLWLNLNQFQVLSDVFINKRISGKDLLKEVNEFVEKKSFLGKIEDEEQRNLFAVSLYNLKNNVHRNHKYIRWFCNILNKLKSESVFEKSFEENDYDSVERTLFPLIEEKSFIEKYLKTFTKISTRVDVEIILSEIYFDQNKIIDKKISNNILDQIEFRENNFYTSIVVGPWLLSWNEKGIVVPVDISNFSSKLKSEICVYKARVKDINEVKEKIAKICVKWNSKYFYSENGDEIHGNHQHFVDEIIKIFELKWKLNQKNLFTYMIDIARENAKIELFFEPSKKFIDNFKLFKSKEFKKFIKEDSSQDDCRIIFDTHSLLDEFVYSLTKKVNKKVIDLVEEFEADFKILKSLDKSFWLRNEKYPEEGKFQQNTEIKTGCPFNQ